MGRFECHSHSHFSNLRLLDSTNTVRGLYEYAKEIGLRGICLTDHECLSGHVEVDKIQQEIIENGEDFKFARGNEIYLTDTRDSNQQYWHFILIAKNKIGHKMLRELSSNSWINSYFDRGMERVPTLKSELTATINKYGKGNLIASTACLGSELDNLIIRWHETKDDNILEQIDNFIMYCKNLFGDDFYLEVQPAKSKEQIIVNNIMPQISEKYNIKIIVTTDAHYLRKQDRFTHKAFLNSKQGDREVDSFYEFAYLQTTEEIIENLKDTNLDYYELEKNTLEIYDKIENYTLQRLQQCPQVEVPVYPKEEKKTGYAELDRLYNSDNEQERYWVNYCIDKLKKLNIYSDEYLSRLDEEARTKSIIGDKLGTCMFSYPIFLQHYIDTIWECGSVVGAGRGSAGAGLNHYLLGITQTDPLKTNAPWFRYLNEERLELPDIDIDVSPSKREKIFEEIRKERGQLGCIQVCTFGTASTKSAILIACRGYRTEKYKNGIDNDIAQYISSLVPVDRGFIWSVNDLLHGNEEKGYRPSKIFINEIKKYPGLIDIISGIEGLIVSRGIHASGVNFYGSDPFETACFMKATNGSIITQYSLHDAEAVGDTKFDFLVTDQCDIMQQCIEMLQENGYIEKDLTLRQAYDKYIHPDVLPLEDEKLWDAIDKANILALFQLNTAVGGNIVRQLLPRSVEELTACNALMRLAGEKGKERPADKYARFKNDISQWYAEMNFRGLTQKEQKVLERYCLADYGAPSSQEVLMLSLMDEDICGFTLAEANAARKIIAKKKMDKIPELRESILTRAKSKALGYYVWDNIIMPQASYSFNL